MKYNIGFFNLLNGRDPLVVYKEVKGLITKYDLDILPVVEATEYADILGKLVDYDYYTTSAYRGGKETGILVKSEHKVSNVNYSSHGDGWITVRGGNRAPVSFPRLTINGHLRVGAAHLPTPTNWVNGKLESPPERYDDYMNIASSIKDFMGRPTKARLVMCDWNEPPHTEGEWSPNWIAKQTKSTIYCPQQLAGRGRIDYAMAKRCTISNIRKDLDFREKSDHEPVVGVLTV